MRGQLRDGGHTQRDGGTGTHGGGEGEGAHAPLEAAEADLLQREQRGRVPDVHDGLQRLRGQCRSGVPGGPIPRWGGHISPSHPVPVAILSLPPSCLPPILFPSCPHLCLCSIPILIPSPSLSHPHPHPIPILIPSPSPSHPHPLPITMSVPSPSSFHPRLSPNLILVPSLSPSCSHPHSDPIPEPIPIPSHAITFPSLSTPAACPVATRRRSGCTARLRGEAGGKGGVVEWRQGTSPPHPGLTSARSRCGAGSGAGGGAGRAGG